MPESLIATKEMSKEESLRLKLQKRLQQISSRQPLEPTYKTLLLNGPIHPPAIPRDVLFKKIGSDLRERIEVGGVAALDIGGKKGKQRDNLDVNTMRAAFTLRECKKHEQEALIAASIGRKSAVEIDRKRKLEGMALGLQEASGKRPVRGSNKLDSVNAAKLRAVLSARQENFEATAANTNVSAKSTAAIAEKVRKKEEEIRRKQEMREIEERRLTMERQKDRERQRELEKERERQAMRQAKEEASRKARMNETPQESLNRLYEPIFKVLWNMEFHNLHGTNPFRLVIDKGNCEAMGVPDYCDVIAKPMNLTYIQEKVDGKLYVTLQDFFADVELMISNALLYNSDPNNEFHIAAKELKKKYKKLAKRLIASLQQQQTNKS